MPESIEPRVVDKRRFADRINDDDVKESIREGLEDIHSIVSKPLEFSPSSVQSATPGMNFGDALKQVVKGQRVTRLEWENPEIWLYMFYWGRQSPKVPEGKYLSIHHADGAVHPLTPNDGDMMADDWVIVI